MEEENPFCLNKDASVLVYIFNTVQISETILDLYLGTHLYIQKGIMGNFSSNRESDLIICKHCLGFMNIVVPLTCHVLVMITLITHTHCAQDMRITL